MLVDRAEKKAHPLPLDRSPGVFGRSSLGGTLILAGFWLHLVWADRLLVQVATGGRGVLQLSLIAIPLLCIGLLTDSQNWIGVELWRRKRFWLTCGCYCALSVFLPVLGVMLAGYDERSLLALTDGLLPLSCLLMGYILQRRYPKSSSRIAGLVFLAVLLQAAVATAQFVQNSGLIDIALLRQLTEWDWDVQRRYSENYVIVGRSVGLYINPNVLGFWSVMGFWAAVLLMRKWRRLICLPAALLSLLLSQSRGAALALMLSMLFWFAIWCARACRRQRIHRPTVHASLAIFWACSVLLFVATTLEAGALNHQFASMMQERLTGGLQALAGIRSDPSLAGRLDAWSTAWQLAGTYPVGTFGPPQVPLGIAIDNDFVRVGLQGSVPLLGSVVLLLATLCRLTGRTDPTAQFLGVAAFAVAVDALSALPLQSAPMSLIWLLLGVQLGRDPRPERSPKVPGHEPT